MNQHFTYILLIKIMNNPPTLLYPHTPYNNIISLLMQS